MLLRLRLIPLAALRLAACAFVLCCALGGQAFAQSAFYTATEAEIAAGPPGSMIRAEPMEGAPLGASAYRVLYRSTSFTGKPIAVSGVIVVPPGEAPASGRPILAWAHPTSGIVPRCAPSLAIFIFQQIQGLRSFVRQGYIVAATDYPGLGTPGPHPYLVGVSEARAVIDSVRAARTMQGADGGARFVVWGHSQGGQAALFTGLIAKHYAPELKLLGVAAAAPATELGALMDDDLDSPAGKNITAMTLWSWTRVYHAPLDKIVAPEAMPVVDRLAKACIESIYDIWIRQKISRGFDSGFLLVQHPAQVEPWRGLLESNTPGALPPTMPVFLAQGLKDEVIRPQVTQDYMAKLCHAGSSVRMFLMPDIGHGRAAQAATLEALGWIADRFVDATPPNDCGK
jgi:pimeloyl-ACP methyl ester carboxylesterase